MTIDARTARRQRQLRLKQAVALGAAGSLVVFFGIIATQGNSRPETIQPVVTLQSSTQNSAPDRAPQPRIRTRTS